MSTGSERIWCVKYWSYSAERFVYVVEDESRYIGSRYYEYEDDIPKSKLLTLEEAKNLEFRLRSKYDNTSVCRAIY